MHLSCSLSISGVPSTASEQVEPLTQAFLVSFPSVHFDDKPAVFADRHDAVLSCSCPAGVYRHHRQVRSDPKPGHQLETKDNHRFHQDAADPDVRWQRSFSTPGLSRIVSDSPQTSLTRRRWCRCLFIGRFSQLHTRIRLSLVPGDPNIPRRTFDQEYSPGPSHRGAFRGLQ